MPTNIIRYRYISDLLELIYPDRDLIEYVAKYDDFAIANLFLLLNSFKEIVWFDHFIKAHQFQCLLVLLAQFLCRLLLETVLQSLNQERD